MMGHIYAQMCCLLLNLISFKSTTTLATETWIKMKSNLLPKLFRNDLNGTTCNIANVSGVHHTASVWIKQDGTENTHIWIKPSRDDINLSFSTPSNSSQDHSYRLTFGANVKNGDYLILFSGNASMVELRFTITSDTRYREDKSPDGMHHMYILIICTAVIAFICFFTTLVFIVISFHQKQISNGRGNPESADTTSETGAKQSITPHRRNETNQHFQESLSSSCLHPKIAGLPDRACPKSSIEALANHCQRNNIKMLGGFEHASETEHPKMSPAQSPRFAAARKADKRKKMHTLADWSGKSRSVPSLCSSHHPLRTLLPVHASQQNYPQGRKPRGGNGLALSTSAGLSQCPLLEDWYETTEDESCVDYEGGGGRTYPRRADEIESHRLSQEENRSRSTEDLPKQVTRYNLEMSMSIVDSWDSDSWLTAGNTDAGRQDHEATKDTVVKTNSLTDENGYTKMYKNNAQQMPSQLNTSGMPLTPPPRICTPEATCTRLYENVLPPCVS